MNFQTLANKKIIIRNNEEIMDLLTLTYVEPYMFEYSLFRVPQEYIARPDLVSIDHYGTDDYVDVICKLNGISNPFELNEGMILALPSAGIINMFYYDLDDIEITSNNSDSNKPSPKRKNEKRKVNEAVIGDQRFKINKELGVVVY